MTLRLILLLALAAGTRGALAADTNAPPPTVAATPAAVAAEASRPATPPPNPNAPATIPTPRNESGVAPAASFEAFRLITERNIFNPNRTGRRERTVEETLPRLDVITLVGTMDSDKGLRAFFDGSEAGFRKVLHVGESVDKFKVTKVAPQSVDLERDGKTLSVRVGQQLRRPEGADWVLAADLQSRAVVADPARVDPNAPPSIPANADDVTRRLMERRAKALKN
jgi:hypothetical protein